MLTSVLKTLGTVFTILGALLTVHAVDPWNVWAFNIGGVFWLAAAIRMKDINLIAVNTGLLAIYLYGVILRL